jgi:Zn-dependent protease with chaperone function
MSGLLQTFDAAGALRTIALLCGGASALFLFSLVYWTARDIAARTRDPLLRLGAVLLVLGLNLFGLVLYVLLRPRETVADRYERELIQELLTREVGAQATARAQQTGPARPVIRREPEA